MIYVFHLSEISLSDWFVLNLYTVQYTRTCSRVPLAAAESANSRCTNPPKI